MKKELVSSITFQSNYYGHIISDLQSILTHFKQKKDISFVWLCGDSSLDNKYWTHGTTPALNGFEDILSSLDGPYGPYGPTMPLDVGYHLNEECDINNSNKVVLNCAVEASTLGERVLSSTNVRLTQHDIFIQENIGKKDVLVVSLGANDISLKWDYWTVYNASKLYYLNSQKSIENDINKCWGGPYFVDLFKNKIEQYLTVMLSKTLPSKVIVCCIYFPDENTSSGGWADYILKMLMYDTNPEILQSVIKGIYKKCHSEIKIQGILTTTTTTTPLLILTLLGTTVVPYPMYQSLNGKETMDYCSRVEPSVLGGSKLAADIFKLL